MFRRLIVSATLAAMAMGTAASALTAKQSVFKEVQSVDQNGQIDTKRIEAELVLPGETVIYALVYNNDQSEAAEDIVLTMPIPEVIVLEEGSERKTGASLLYSADDGDSFHSRKNVMVIDYDGSLQVASADQLTHVRWSLDTPIQPGAQGELSFKGRLK